MSCAELWSQGMREALRFRDHMHREPISGKPPNTASLVGADWIQEDSCACVLTQCKHVIAHLLVERGSKLGTGMSLKGRGNQTEQENSCLRNITVRQKFLTMSLYKGNNHYESTCCPQPLNICSCSKNLLRQQIQLSSCPDPDVT